MDKIIKGTKLILEGFITPFQNLINLRRCYNINLYNVLKKVNDLENKIDEQEKQIIKLNKIMMQDLL